MSSNWKINSQIKASSASDRRQEIINTLLRQRGLTTKAQQKNFLNPPHPADISPEKTGISKSQLKKALKRINQAIQAKDMIYIYGDFDADGVCATAILWETLHQLGANVMPYIPTRESKTRGLSQLGIDELLPNSPSLIITVDNGIASFKACQYAKKKKIDVIITDHHQPKHKAKKSVFPPASAIIHTTNLSGAGVAWFLARALTDQSLSLDLVTLATIADMVPLTEYNRSLVKHGLDQLNQTTRPGLQALAKTAAIDLAQVTTHEVSYRLAPRLNAMGRLEHALDSLRLLCTTSTIRANQLAGQLNQTNQLRQNLTETMFNSAKNQWLKTKQTKKLIFISDKTFHEGVVGLVAGKLVEKFHRPAVVVAQGKTQSKASARSIKGFNVIKTFRSIEKLFLELGGHELAAGFTAENKNLPDIQKKLEALAKKQLASDQLQPELAIDCQIEFKDINWQLFNQLEKLQPFGFANFRPVFTTRGVKVTHHRHVGKENKHLKLKLEDIDAIAFNLGPLADQLKTGQLIDIAYTIEDNTWNNKTSLQLKIKEIQL